MTDTHDDHQPEVLEAYWDRDQIHALFADLTQGAEVRRVQVRTAADNLRPEDAAVTLERARELLDDERTKAIQIYYDFDGTTWCDTLVILPDAIRIIRATVLSMP